MERETHVNLVSLHARATQLFRRVVLVQYIGAVFGKWEGGSGSGGGGQGVCVYLRN